jgi:translation initiation factor 4E
MSSSVQSSLPAPALHASKAALNAALADMACSEPGEVQEIEVDMALQAETLKTVFNDPKNFNVKVRVFFSLGRGYRLSPFRDLFDSRDG